MVMVTQTGQAELPFVPDKWDNEWLTKRIPGNQLSAIDQPNPTIRPPQSKRARARARALARGRARIRKSIHARTRAVSDIYSICHAERWWRVPLQPLQLCMNHVSGVLSKTSALRAFSEPEAHSNPKPPQPDMP